MRQFPEPLDSVRHFVTQHKEHAVAASQPHSINYPPQPLSSEPLNEALQRGTHRNAMPPASQTLDESPIPGTTRPARIAIKEKGRILFIDPLQIVSAHAEGNYVLLHKGATSYLLRISISDLLEKLKPWGFIRIHRSFLVNGSLVEEIYPHATGNYRLRIKGGNEYPVARSYRRNLNSLADAWIGTNSFLSE